MWSLKTVYHFWRRILEALVPHCGEDIRMGKERRGEGGEKKEIGEEERRI